MSSNNQRADTVADIVAAYADDDLHGAIADLMCDMRHWAASQDESFSTAWHTGDNHYWAEIRGDDQPEGPSLADLDPELFAQVQRREPLSPAEWQRANMLVYGSAPDLPQRYAPFTPPVADDSNPGRAQRAEAAVQAYADRTGLSGDDPYTQLGDMLCDLMHLCAREGVDITYAAWTIALENFVEEVRGGGRLAPDEFARAAPDLDRAIQGCLQHQPHIQNRELTAAQWQRAEAVIARGVAPEPEYQPGRSLEAEFFGGGDDNALGL